MNGQARNGTARQRLSAQAGFALVLTCLASAAFTQAARAQAPDASQAALEGGRQLMAAGDHQGAIDVLTRAIESRPNFAEAYQLRAEAYAGVESTLEDEAARNRAHGRALRDRMKAREILENERLVGEIGSLRALFGAVILVIPLLVAYFAFLPYQDSEDDVSTLEDVLLLPIRVPRALASIVTTMALGRKEEVARRSIRPHADSSLELELMNSRSSAEAVDELELETAAPCPGCGRRNALTTRICPRCERRLRP